MSRPDDLVGQERAALDFIEGTRIHQVLVANKVHQLSIIELRYQDATKFSQNLSQNRGQRPNVL